MDCPRCRHRVPDRANFCQTCGHQFALKVVKAKGSRLGAIFFLFGAAALLGAYALVRLNSSSNVAPVGNASQPVAISAPPAPAPTATADIPAPASQAVSSTPVESPFSAPRDTESPPADVNADTRPIALNRPQPNYTEDARKNRVEGTVRVRALIGADGSVRNVVLVSHLPDGLDDEAILAVRQMRFRPATKNGQPVNFWQVLEVEFNLK